MYWKGKNLKTYPEIIDFALELEEKEQKEFVDAYSKSSHFALENIGYFTGYYPKGKAEQIMKVFNTEHPVFGKTIPSNEKAYAHGVRRGRRVNG